MFCWKCGENILENERYCPDCGADQNFEEEGWVEETGGITKTVAVKTGNAIKKFTVDILVEVTASILTDAMLISGKKAGMAVAKKIRKWK